ncbi:enoyl-CoA hydratase/isomerase family protein [Amylibacter sp. SFDW26]|uniref:enoyl-CoA hydratase/isomerase family protein n=1 Tax=Amylibacter sp. SFDW26 TaxID=2652722 RepID=UPI00186A50B9|nr:enoyl-CoA hydratase/isomerase family protein [Amylibacter sp. SFDW26]
MTDINIRITGRVGHITLTRPQALNALNHAMALAIEKALDAWEKDDNIAFVLIDAEGEKAFCAGGDIADFYRQGTTGNHKGARSFWRDEYRLNAKIANYSKPYVALMDRIVMGGGVGISAHGSHRIVTDRTMLAMPECAIGLLPDVGGTYLLANTPGACGEYLGLTGAHLSGADCLYAGVADYYIPSEKLNELHDALLQDGDLSVLEAFHEAPGLSRLQEQQPIINSVFSLETIPEMMAMLADIGSDFSMKALKAFKHGAPYSQMATLIAIRDARNGDLEQALRNEYRFVSISTTEGEFLEGIRAAVIDKDRNPVWKFPTLADVPKTLLAKMHQAAEDGDFKL